MLICSTIGKKEYDIEFVMQHMHDRIILQYKKLVQLGKRGYPLKMLRSYLLNNHTHSKILIQIMSRLLCDYVPKI